MSKVKYQRNPLKERYPSIDLAYDIAISSYETAVKRLDVIDGRLQTLLTLLATVTFIVPTIANSRGISFISIWFIEAAIFIIAAIFIGIYARLFGEVKLLRPKAIYENYLHLSEERFKIDFIYYASEDYEANTSLIKKKWKLTVLITILFLIAGVFLGLWVLDTRVLPHRSGLSALLVWAAAAVFSVLLIAVLSLEAYFVDRYRPSKILLKVFDNIKHLKIKRKSKN